MSERAPAKGGVVSTPAWSPEGETGCVYVKVCNRDRAMHEDRYGLGHDFVPPETADVAAMDEAMEGLA